MNSPGRLLLTVVLLAAPAAHAEDWPQFRGPSGQGQSSERDLPFEWSETKNVVWRTPIKGLGWSSPVVSGGRVWLTVALEKEDPISLRILAFDAATGKERLSIEAFTVVADPLLNAKNSYASPTPIVEGDRVYLHFGPYGTAAMTTSGEILWKTRLPYDPGHGNGGSPALWNDLLIVNCDGIDEHYVAALDKKTGALRWKTPRPAPSGHAYSTPLVIRAGDVDQVVSVGAFHTVAYEPRTGKEIWRVDYEEGYSNVPRPLFSHGFVYITTGLQRPVLTAIRPDGSGNVTKSHVAWRMDRTVPVTPSPIVAGDEIYMVSDIGVATCLDAKTGELRWQERLGGNFSASPVLAGGRIFFLNEAGITTVIEPGKEFRRLAVNPLGEAWVLASIAVSDGSLFIRTADDLFRIGQR